MKSLHALWLLPVAAIVTPAYAADYLTVEQAQKNIFPDAQAFFEHHVTLTSDQRKQIEKLSSVRQHWGAQKMWCARKDGKTVGWFIVDSVMGKHALITYATGLGLDGKVVRVEILRYREAHAGGVKEKLWLDHFIGKTLYDAFKLGEDVPYISEDMQSSQHVMDGVKRLLVMQTVLGLY